MKKSRKWSLWQSLAVSLLVHLLVALFVVFTPSDFFEKKKPDVVQVEFVQPTPAPRMNKTPPPPPKAEKTQVVDQDEKPHNNETPDEVRFLSAHNQVVKKQTIAQRHGEFRNSSSKQHGTGGKPQQVFKPLNFDDVKPKFDVSKSIQDHLEIEKEREKQSEDDAIKRFEEKKKQKVAETHAPASAETPGSGGSQGSQTIDYIKDLDPGLETLLSTKEFVYYTYYSRIRRQLNQYWGPKVKEKLTNLYRQGRSIASSDDKVTKLLISLDRSGNLLKVQVIGNSGVRDLDEAAVEAFRAAAPFPNPPEGMIDPDGLIKIRWDFILEA